MAFSSTPADVPLAGVDFEDDDAREAARAAGLHVSAFEGRYGSGEGGAFTLDDVEDIIEDWS
jgi:hypothetical protein